MTEINPLQKLIGIALGFAVVLGVGGVTWKEETARSAMNAAQAALSASTSVAVASPAQSATKPAVSSVVPVRSRSDDDGNDDGGGSSIPATAPVVTAPPPATMPKQTASVYKNGTYTATGSYMSPGGQEQLGVTVTLANDIITNATVTSMAYDGTSRRYQQMFISGYQQYVIGQDIANVNLTYVSGSSLTPEGFDDALSQIKAQAKA